MAKKNIGCQLTPVTWSKLFIATFCLLLCACGRSGSDKTHALPDLPLPASWDSQHKDQAQIQSSWIKNFNDPVLNKLINDSLQDNFDLQMQLARWQQFQARARIAGADKQLQASANAGVTRRYQESSFSDDYSTDYNLSASLSWELDLWGKLSNRTQAAILLEEAALADYQSLRLSIAARVAQAWYACLLNHLQIALLEETIQAWDLNIKSAEKRFQRGTLTALDVQRLLQARNADAASLSERKQEFSRRKRDLQLLIGHYPHDRIAVSKQLPVLSASVPSDQPSSLLKRRHDIIAAEKRFFASLNQEDAARKDLLPSFRLSGEAGYASDDLSDVFKPASFLWNIIAGISAPIFQGGRLRATVDLRYYEMREAAASWGKTVLNACHEVEVSLSNEIYIRQRVDELAVSVKHAQTSHKQALRQFDNGLVTINDVLDIKRSLLSSQVRLLAAQHALIANRIDLHRALGGDFTLEEIEAEL